MTLEEFKNKVAESPNVDKLNGRIVNLNYQHIYYNNSLTGITAIYEFLAQQIEGFKSAAATKRLPSELASVLDTFERCKTAIIRIVSNATSESEWVTTVKDPLEKDRPVKFLYDSPQTIFLINLHNEQPDFYAGAYEFITSNNLQNIQKKMLIGYLLAYEFYSTEYSVLTHRTSADIISIEKMKNDFNKYLTNSESHLSKYLAEGYKKVTTTTKNIDDLVEDKKNNYDKWFKSTSEKFSGYFAETTKKMLDLENLYQEKLKLEAPAKYWQNRALALRREGFRWLYGLIASLLIAVAILVWVLVQISDGTIEKLFSNTGSAIKWSVVLITIISFLAYAIRTFSKLTFSSFHLFRDAQEREQLTYVYLALKKEKGIDQTERHLIMQSLFSRSDSGLLKDDGSPTMPGNIVDKLVTK